MTTGSIGGNGRIRVYVPTRSIGGNGSIGLLQNSVEYKKIPYGMVSKYGK